MKVPATEDDGNSSEVEPHSPVIEFGGGSDGIVLAEPGGGSGPVLTGGEPGLGVRDGDGNDGVVLNEMVREVGNDMNALGVGGGCVDQLIPVWTGGEPGSRGNDGVTLSEIVRNDLNALEVNGVGIGEPGYGGGNDGIVLGEPDVGFKGIMVGNDRNTLGVGGGGSSSNAQEENNKKSEGIGGRQVSISENGGKIEVYGGHSVENVSLGGGIEQGFIGNFNNVVVVKFDEILDSEVGRSIEDMVVVGQGQKRKRGRPKGSKTKNKNKKKEVVNDGRELVRNDDSNDKNNDEEKGENVGEVFLGNDDVGKRVRELFESDSEHEENDCFEGKKDEVFEEEKRVDDEGLCNGEVEGGEDGGKEMMVVEVKKKRGRPKGVKNKPKMGGNGGEVGGEGFGNGGVLVDCGKGLKKGSRKRKKDVGGEVGGEVEKKVEKRGRNEGLNEGLSDGKVEVIENGGNEMSMVKKKQGRPKGGKIKPRMGKNGGEVSGEGFDNGGGLVDCGKGLKEGSRKRKKDVGLSCEVGGEVEKKVEKQGGNKGLNEGLSGGNEMSMVKKRGWPKGGKKHVIVFALMQEKVMEKKVKCGGRPKGSKKREEDVILVDEMERELEKKVEKRGRPKGSKKSGKSVNVDSEAGSEVLQNVNNDIGDQHDGSKELVVVEAMSEPSLKGDDNVRTRLNQKLKKRGRPKGKKNKRLILVDGVLHKVISSQQGGRSLVVQKDMGLGEFPHCGNGKVGDGKMLHESTNGQKRPQRKTSKYQLRARNMPEGVNGSKREQSSMCHQCLKCENDEVIVCSYCKRKRYCLPCLIKWYPERTKKEVEEACPFCRGNCNCKACLQEKLVMKDRQKDIDRKVKLDRLLYMICKINPLLKRIQEEQRAELEVEARKLGAQFHSCLSLLLSFEI